MNKMQEIQLTCHTRSRMCLSAYILFPMISSSIYYLFQTNVLHRNDYLKWIEKLWSVSKHEEKTTYIYISVSSVVEFQRWLVLKSKISSQESTYSKDFFNLSMNDSFTKSAKIVLSRSIFDVKKNFRKKSFVNINLEDHFLLKTCFLLSKHVASWPKILLFRTHHLWNSTNELILVNSSFCRRPRNTLRKKNTKHWRPQSFLPYLGRWKFVLKSYIKITLVIIGWFKKKRQLFASSHKIGVKLRHEEIWVFSIWGFVELIFSFL